MGCSKGCALLKINQKKQVPEMAFQKTVRQKVLPVGPLIAGAAAFLLATSCCWLPALAAAIFGSAVGATAFSQKIEPLGGLLMAVGAAAAAFGLWKFFRKERTAARVLESRISCPNCGFQKTETMPTNACQFFYECENCHARLKPLQGDCCVFCSYGTVKCPPMQSGEQCC